MKILHITESFGAGVEHFLQLVTRGQAAAGHQVLLAHSIRADTPVKMLDTQFLHLAKRTVVQMVTQVSVLQDILSVWRLMSLIRQERPDVVHLHSSKAGVLGRVAAWLSVSDAQVFYSPHGFAFLRQDVSLTKQKLYLLFEQLAAKLGDTLVACSQSELNLAVEKVRHSRVRFVENAIDLSKVQRSQGSTDGQVYVFNAGRVCYQKGPWRFSSVASACTDLPVQFVWIGNGEMADSLLSAHAPNLQLTGWVTHAEVSQRLTRADVFLMPSLWEGMPLALIEAQAAGVPAVVPNVVGCKDVVQHGVTGFVCDSNEDLCARTRELVANAQLRRRMGENAAQMASTRFAVERMNKELLQLYAGF